MFEGDYAIHRGKPQKNGDGLDTVCVRFGYSTLREAYRACPSVAAEEKLNVNDLFVVRMWAYQDGEPEE